MHPKVSNKNCRKLFRYLQIGVILFAFFLCQSVKGGNPIKIDSLKNILAKTAVDIEKVSLLNSLSKEIMDIDYQQSLQYATEALQLSQKINDTIGLMEANFSIGQVYVNYSLNYKKGLVHLVEALKLVRKTDRRKSEIGILGLIGFVHNRLGDFEKAIEYYRKAINLAEKNDFKNEYTNFISYIADLFETNGAIDSAILYYGKIYEIEKEKQFVGTSSIVLFSIGKYFQLKGEDKQSLLFYLQALKKFQESNNHRWASYTYHILAELTLKNKDYKTALINAHKGLALAEQFKLIKEIEDNHYSLSKIYDSIGNHEMAYKHYKALKVINDSIFSIERVKEVASIQANYEIAIKKQELDLLTQEKELQIITLQKNRAILIIISAGGLLLLLLLIYLWRSYQQKQRMNSLLKDRNELRELKMEEIVNRLNEEVNQHKLTQNKLEELNEELNNFFYKSSHDLRSPLTSIIGLTNIAMQEISEKERLDVLNMINYSTDKLRKLLDELGESAKVNHGNIKIVPINFSEFVKEIIQQLKNADFFKNVSVEILSDSNLLILSDENLLRSIIQNLMDNGIKYYNSSSLNPYVKIAAECVKDGFKIIVSDNGQGIEKDQQPKVFDMFVRSSTEIQGSGLGLYIVKKSVKRLGGTIDLKSERGIGTTFTISLPIQ